MLNTNDLQQLEEAYKNAPVEATFGKLKEGTYQGLIKSVSIEQSKKGNNMIKVIIEANNTLVSTYLADSPSASFLSKFKTIVNKYQVLGTTLEEQLKSFKGTQVIIKATDNPDNTDYNNIQIQ
jgi:hypothetical protein